MSTLKELLAQREELDKLIAGQKNESRAKAIAEVTSLMKEYGLSVADVFDRPKKRDKKATMSKVLPKYRNTATGETWSGRGLKPKWMSKAIEGGAKLEDFAI